MRLFYDVTSLPTALVELVLMFSARQTGWETPVNANFFVDVLCQAIYDYCDVCDVAKSERPSVFSISSGLSPTQNWKQFGSHSETKVVLCIRDIHLGHLIPMRDLLRQYFCFLEQPCFHQLEFWHVYCVCMDPQCMYNELQKLEAGVIPKPSPFQWSIIERGIRYYERTMPHVRLQMETPLLISWIDWRQLKDMVRKVRQRIMSQP